MYIRQYIQCTAVFKVGHICHKGSSIALNGTADLPHKRHERQSVISEAWECNVNAQCLPLLDHIHAAKTSAHRVMNTATYRAYLRFRICACMLNSCYAFTTVKAVIHET